jgi:hypothetical protein
MGLDIYVGPLSRFYAHDWDPINVTLARAAGYRVEIHRPEPAAGALSNPEAIAERISAWRQWLNAAMPRVIVSPLDRDDSSQRPVLHRQTRPRRVDCAQAARGRR